MLNNTANLGDKIPEVPCGMECEAVCMMADISGYTALSRNLCMLGSDGVIYCQRSSTFFDTLVGIAPIAATFISLQATQSYVYGMPFVQGRKTNDFTDALAVNTMLFELVGINHKLDKVNKAAINSEIEINMEHIQLPESLGLHCGIGVEKIELAAIGSPPGLMNGTPLSQVERALTSSVRGDFMSTEAWGIIKADGIDGASLDWVGVDVDEGVKRLELKNLQVLECRLLLHLARR